MIVTVAVELLSIQLCTDTQIYIYACMYVYAVQ